MRRGSKKSASAASEGSPAGSPSASDTQTRDISARPSKHGVWTFLKELPILVGLALGIALVIKVFLVQAFYIPSESMVPTLEVRDRVLVSKLSYRFGEPERGDIVVFRSPYDVECPKPGPGVARPPSCDRSFGKKVYNWFAELFGLPSGETQDFIKRVIGLPGETVSITDGDVFVDGRKIDLPSTPTSGPQKDRYSMDPYKVPKGSYWVMGDNRANSQDSRTFKAIPRSKIVGRAFVLLWPPTRFETL